jgi:hypothetical protein
MWNKKRAFLYLKNCDLQAYSFQKLTHFPQGNNAQDAAASNTDGFLSTDTCVSSTLLSRTFWNKISHSLS